MKNIGLIGGGYWGKNLDVLGLRILRMSLVIGC